MKTMRLSSFCVIAHVAAAVLLLMAGCSDNQLTDERNPFYLRGKKLVEQQKPEEAVEAFQKCLRLSPESAKAYLQLGIIYEDTFNDPPAALHNYRQYLRQRPDSDNADVVRRWVQRAEKAYYRELHKQYGLAPIVSGNRVTDQEEEQKQLERTQILRAERDDLAAKVNDLTARISALTGKLNSFQKPAEPLSAESATPAQQATVTTMQRNDTADSVYTVQKGDTLSQISREFYGTLKYWPLLRDYNHAVLHGKETLRPGMVLQVPPLSKLTE